MSTAILDANLAALAGHNPRLVQRIRAAQPSPDCAFAPTPQDVPALSLGGSQLCSRHRPLDEAGRFAASIDIVEHAAVVVLGFGAGYHVQRLAERLRKTGLIIVYEPDVAMLRAVFERVDHSAWISATNLVIADEAEDRASLASQLAGAEGIVAQGATIESHLPSRTRLGDGAGRFGKMLADLVSNIRTTMLTTLVHSSTTCRNLSLNLDHYGAGEGIAPLQGIAAGRTALLIAAGPSLSRHYELLADPSLRERVVIIAVQTCLRPLLRRGIRPHFVTALDYHEISRHFYDGLDPHELRDITLVCEPKVNRIVIESYPGPIRCVANGFLDRLLGPLARDMGAVPAGSTVAHLSFYLAQYLGCDPIALVGQDLGFTDNLYYGPGAAIHDQWAPELNAFNTIDMMEWARVARMKRNLRQARSQSGGSMLIDEQMSTYLTQFERDFSNAPQTIIDAQGGGAAKQHTVVRPLEQVLAEAGSTPLPDFAAERRPLNLRRLGEISRRIQSVRGDVQQLERISRDTGEVLGKMIERQRDAAAMKRLFEKVRDNQRRVDRLERTHDLVNNLNQLGVFKRLRADRRLELTEGLEPLERQKAQLERDQTNVRWLADACAETRHILDDALRVLRGESVSTRIGQGYEGEERGGEDVESHRPRRIAAMIAVDPERDGLLRERSLADAGGGCSLLQRTLERLGRCRRIESIVLLVPRGLAVGELIDEQLIDRPVAVREIDGPIFDEAHAAVAAARQWSDWCWRGGIGGMTIFDEIITPTHMAAAMTELQLDAAVIVGPDWPLLDWSESTGCDALIARYLEHPESHRIVFTQAPPGLCGILIEASLMREMAQRVRQFTLGSMLSYIPSLPQLDPTSKDACVKLPAEIRNHAGRYIGGQRVAALAGAIGPQTCGEDLLAAITATPREVDAWPQQIEIELTTRRPTQPRWMADAAAPIDAEIEMVERVLRGASARDDLAVTFGGRGDPLLHPQCREIVELCRDLGCRGIHIRTDLPDSFDALQLLDWPVEVLSIELQAETAATYEAVMGVNRFDDLRRRVDALINARSARTGSPNRLALPWIVPRMARCRATLDEMRNFYDRWLHYAGAAMIDPWPGEDDAIALDPPSAALDEINRRTLQVRADATAFAGPSAWRGPAGEDVIDLTGQSLAAAWSQLQSRVRWHSDHDEADAPALILEFGAA